MNIPSAKYLKNKARLRLESGQEPQKVVQVYAAIAAVMALAVNIVQYLVSNQMSTAGGLANIGTRSTLTTISNVLPLVQSVVMMCVGLGYTAAMLRIARRQFASPKTLKAGAERFWVLLRSRLLIGLLYAALGLAVSYVAAMLFMFSPFSARLTEALTPFISGSAMTPEAILASDDIMNVVMQNSLPVLVIYAILYIPLLAALAYRYRLVDYILIDQPGCGARYAMRQSRIMMRGNVMKLLKIDLSFWRYFILRAAVMVLTYLDLILAAFGVNLPFSPLVRYIVFVLAYVGADAAVTLFFQNSYETTLALAYDSLVPKEKNDGVVLGSIFQ